MSKCKNICMAKIVTHFLPLLLFMVQRENPFTSQHSALLEWGLFLSKLICFYRTALASVSLLCADLMSVEVWWYCKWQLVFLKQYLALYVCCLAVNFIFQHVLIFFVGRIVAGMVGDRLLCFYAGISLSWCSAWRSCYIRSFLVALKMQRVGGRQWKWNSFYGGISSVLWAVWKLWSNFTDNSLIYFCEAEFAILFSYRSWFCRAIISINLIITLYYSKYTFGSRMPRLQIICQLLWQWWWLYLMVNHLFSTLLSVNCLL